MKIEIENLKGLVFLKDITDYQKSLAIDELNKLINYVDELETKIKKPKRKFRSIKANALYWLWLTCLEDESGEDKNKYHIYFRYKFLKVTIEEIFGEKILTIQSTTELDDRAFSFYMNRVQAEAATEFNTRVPLPEDQGFKEFMDKYESFR